MIEYTNFDLKTESNQKKVFISVFKNSYTLYFRNAEPGNSKFRSYCIIFSFGIKFQLGQQKKILT
jgi:hypothetical protein